jgi:hypothetical protein
MGFKGSEVQILSPRPIFVNEKSELTGRENSLFFFFSAFCTLFVPHFIIAHSIPIVFSKFILSDLLVPVGKM